MSCEYGSPNQESKPWRIGRNCGQLAEVPLADHAGGVAARLQHFGERDLLGRQPVRRVVAKTPWAPSAPALPNMPLRTGSRPVSSAARLGEHTGWT